MNLRPALSNFALAVFCFLALATGGCSAQPETAPGGTLLGQGDPQVGAELYAEMCANCHGNAAEGGLGPRLIPWTKGVATLVKTIDVSMPQGQPEKCDRECAEDIAAYLTGLEVDCGGGRALPRRLRLLSRREYGATVADLFTAGMGAVCSADTDCNVAKESCTGGVCTADPCNLHTFMYDAGASNPSTVHVAGTFNGWPQTIAAGGFAMQKVGSTGTWYVKHAVTTGFHEYKFVLNESEWIADPKNPQQTGDFGNSVLSVSCNSDPGAGGLPDVSKDFPAESKPTGFAFDSSDSSLVTSVHVDQYWKAAALLADAALLDIKNLLPCDIAIDPDACAEDFVVDFGKRAFRRPLSEEETSRYKNLLLKAPDAKTGVRNVVRTLLSSPYFLYRSEVGAALGDGTFRLTPHETATLLSYTFWGTMPDAELFAAADDGSLEHPETLEAQSRRLLADSRSRPVFDAFAVEWLGVTGVTSLSKDGAMFPEWDSGLSTSMLEETRRFFGHVVFDGSGKFEDLLLSDTTFVDAKLAAFYGLPAPQGAFSQVPAAENRKAGLLGHASVLSSAAYSNQSSPIRRGLFVRRAFLCQELPPPPANAATVPEVDANATTRERFSQHSTDPVCANCHQYIDNVGFGFEKFDAIGRFREMENGKPIDASGDLNDVEALGTKTHAPFASLRELGGILAESHASKACFAKQTYRFAMGKLDTAEDACGVGELSAAFEQSGGDIKELWIALSKLDEFTRRK